MKPLIGLTTLYDPEERPQKLRYYLQALEGAGARVVIFHPSTFNPTAPEVQHLDGLVLGGGGDVHPKYYGQPIFGTKEESISEPRDEMEFFLIELALERDIPLLAICRGFQVLNVALGGTLIQDLPGHESKGDQITRHLVQVEPGTRLWEALGRPDVLEVNSHHHQGVGPGELAPRLRSSARLLQGIPLLEGIESPDHRWIVGVQWHPERMHEFPEPSRSAQERLFQTLVREAARSPVR